MIAIITIAVPHRMANRPRDPRGFPIPFAQYVGRNGIPDFRILDDVKVQMCLNTRRCGLCGQPMGKNIFFVGGPLCVQNGVFTDPPMHRECAEFALRACVHLNRTKGKFSPKESWPTDVITGEATLTSNEKAEWFALMHGRKFIWTRSPADKMIYIKANLPWVDVQRWRDGEPM